jgi:hypothetical protein
VAAQSHSRFSLPLIKFSIDNMKEIDYLIFISRTIFALSTSAHISLTGEIFFPLCNGISFFGVHPVVRWGPQEYLFGLGGGVIPIPSSPQNI